MNHLEEIQQTPPLSNSDELASVISYETAEDVVNPLRLQGYRTQYPDLNDTGGLKLKSFTVIAAEQGVGKSLFALGLAIEQMQRGIKCAYFDLENGEALTVERLIRIRFQIDKKTILGFSPNKVLDHVRRITGINYYSPRMIHSRVEAAKQVDATTTVKDIILRRIRINAGQGVKIFVLDPFSRICENEAETELHDEGKLAGELADLA